MTEVIPEKYADLFEKQAFGNLTTLMKDGSPQVTPVWVDFDGKHVRVNSARGRQKDKNIARDPRVSLSIQDPANPYRYLEIRGKVVEATEKGAAKRSASGVLHERRSLQLHFARRTRVIDYPFVSGVDHRHERSR